MSSSFITVVVPIEPGRDGAVLSLVVAMGNPPKPDLKVAIRDLGIVHFMSINVIRADAGRAHILMEISADKAAAPTLGALARAISLPLECILAAAGIPPASRTDLAAFLLRHNRVLGTTWANSLSSTGALGLPFCGSPDMTVERILSEDKLAKRIAEMRTLLHGRCTARDKLRAVREVLWRAGDTKWAFVPLQAPFLGPARPRTVAITAQILVAALPALLWPLVLAPLAVWFLGCLLVGVHSVWVALGLIFLTFLTAAGVIFLGLRHAEATDVPDDAAPNPGAVAAIMAEENKSQLNLLVAVARIKRGWLRQLTLRGVMWLTSQALARSGIPGFLGRIGVVHYARWILLPGTGQLIFCSNYDGSFEGYLEDFIELEPSGTTGVWTNCQGFPRTRLLFGGGTADGDRFRRWVRCQQIPTAFWYAAYPELTLERIRINARIRHGIAAAETDIDAKAWVALFGAPTP